MFYRVDYTLAILFAGFLTGALLSGPTKNIVSSRLARGYYAVVAILLILRTGAYVCAFLDIHADFAQTLGGISGDLLGLSFGALFGLAARCKDAREFLTDSFILDALRMELAFTFALFGIGKMFNAAPMTEFFTQSGYSVAFLKFIEIAEIFGGIGLLLPWAVVPAWTGLTVDMFGAVLTHVHNRDPLNDSTDAIAMLIRLIAIGVLWALRGRDGKPSLTVRKSISGVTAVAMACLLIAIGGGAAVRHLNPPTSRIVAPSSK
jgi:uncharacterized membrane protein YphA (DoxX/SURF4 family)